MNMRKKALALLLAAALMAGMPVQAFAESVEEPAAATIPADGDPADETAKGSYTAEDAVVMAANETVVATAGEYPLTNGQLQVCYWMEVQSFLSSYGGYAAYFGLDYTQPLDTQVCGISENGCTWQQFFLASALNSWKNYQAMAAEAEKNGFRLDAALQEELDSLPESLEQNAVLYGFDSAEDFLQFNVGKGATVADYQHFMELYYVGMQYFNALSAQAQPSEAEVEAYFAEHEEAYLENGLSREDKYVDVRHILIMPEGADSSNIRTETFDEAAWSAAKTEAARILDLFAEGDRSEDSFAALAVEYSQDGNAADGGLYTGISKGQMVENFESWCFDETRAGGDYGIVETEFGYHLMYYVGAEPVWKGYVESELTNIRSQELVNEIAQRYPMEADFENMLLAFVDMGGEESNAVTDGVTQIVETPVVEEKAEAKVDMTAMGVLAGVSVVCLAAAAFVFRKKEQH